MLSKDQIPTKATGGNIVPDSSSYRVYPRKSGENWVAKMMDLPYHQYSDTRFTIMKRELMISKKKEHQRRILVVIKLQNTNNK